MSRVLLSSEPLSVEATFAQVLRPEIGGTSLFVGTVRNTNAGQVITQLDYHAYDAMALAEMERIRTELEHEFPGSHVAFAHRIGTLMIGDIAVIVAAAAAHRGEAFEVCRLGIDRIKARVPIWKREYGPDGPYWVGWQDARTPST
jgi:molybdopterin synthase catalytic subunit